MTWKGTVMTCASPARIPMRLLTSSRLLFARKSTATLMCTTTSMCQRLQASTIRTLHRWQPCFSPRFFSSIKTQSAAFRAVCSMVAIAQWPTKGAWSLSQSLHSKSVLVKMCSLGITSRPALSAPSREVQSSNC